MPTHWRGAGLRTTRAIVPAEGPVRRHEQAGEQLTHLMGAGEPRGAPGRFAAAKGCPLKEGPASPFMPRRRCRCTCRSLQTALRKLRNCGKSRQRITAAVNGRRPTADKPCGNCGKPACRSFARVRQWVAPSALRAASRACASTRREAPGTSAAAPARPPLPPRSRRLRCLFTRVHHAGEVTDYWHRAPQCTRVRDAPGGPVAVHHW